MLLNKIKSLTIRPEVFAKIHLYASKYLDRMFDDRFEEDNQCGGYYAFKDLVFLQESLSKGYDKWKDGDNFGTKESDLLRRIHPNARNQALHCARRIRKTYKIYKDAD